MPESQTTPTPVKVAEPLPNPPPEQAKPIEKVIAKASEVQAIGKVAVRSRARQFDRLGNKEQPKALQNELTAEVVSFDRMVKLENSVFNPPINLANGSKLRVIYGDDGVTLRAAGPNETDGVFELDSLNSKSGDSFNCVSGTTLLQIPIEVMHDAQLTGILTLNKQSPEGNKVLTSAQEKVLEVYLQSRYSGSDEAMKDIDTALLLEAANANGQVTNEVLAEFVKNKVTEHVPPENGKLTVEQEKANAARNELLERLGKSTIADGKDIAELVKIYAPSQIDSAVAALDGRIKELAKYLDLLTPVEREKTQNEIRNLIGRINELRSSESTMLSAGNSELENFFASIQNGDIDPAVGIAIINSFKNGDMAGVVGQVIDAKLALIPKDDPRKAKWDASLKKIGEKTLFAGGGLAALAVYFAIIGGKREQ